MLRHAATLAAAALVLGACGDGQDPPPRDAEERAALEEELAESRTTIRDLELERDALERELEVARERPGEPPDAGPRSGPGVPSPWTAEGLVDQPRVREEVGPDGEPFAATPWRPTELPDGLEERYPSIGALATDLAAALEGAALGSDAWEVTVRAYVDPEDATQGTVTVLSWGLLDDAIAGRDLRVTVLADDDAWRPGGAEERAHCRRGVSDDGLCL